MAPSATDIKLDKTEITHRQACPQASQPGTILLLVTDT